jgi:low affinity Fe/Cu permease
VFHAANKKQNGRQLADDMRRFGNVSGSVEVMHNDARGASAGTHDPHTTIARPITVQNDSIGWLERVSTAITDWTGRTSAFTWALVLVAGWFIAGPFFHYSNTWQLFINTITNLVTFLMVFLIQRAQNKDTLALQLKVNELIAAQKGAHNALIAIEDMSEQDLRALHARFLRMAQVARASEVAADAVPQPDVDEDRPERQLQPPTT